MYYGIYLPVFLSYLAIATLGLLNLFVLDKKLFFYQLAFFLISLTLYFTCSFFSYKWYKKLSFLVYIVNIVLLLLVFVLGEITRGSTRWISLGIINIQPSEFIKIAIILALSSI